MGDPLFWGGLVIPSHILPTRRYRLPPRGGKAETAPATRRGSRKRKLNFLRALLLRCNAKCSQIKSPPFRVAVSILLCNRVLCTCWCTGLMRRDSMEHEKAQPKEAPNRGLWGTLFVVRHSVSALSSTLVLVFILYLVHIFAQSLSLCPTAWRPSIQDRRLSRPWRPLRPPDESRSRDDA
jgi:hypothetical protein